MANLVIVESPSKASTIKGYLGQGYKVMASKGHVRDLPKSTLGVDIDAGFEPNYISEHEMKFTDLGVPIKFVIFRKKPGEVKIDPVRWVMPGAFAKLREDVENEEEDAEE